MIMPLSHIYPSAVLAEPVDTVANPITSGAKRDHEIRRLAHAQASSRDCWNSKTMKSSSASTFSRGMPSSSSVMTVIDGVEVATVVGFGARSDPPKIHSAASYAALSHAIKSGSTSATELSFTL